MLLIKTVKEERNSERKGRRREPKKKGDVLMAKLLFPLEKKAPSVTGTFSRGLDDTSSRIDSERIFILLIQLFCVLLIFVFPCRLFGQFFTGGWQTLVSILVTIYFGTVFVRVIVFQCNFLICCCSLRFSLYRLRMESEGQFSGRCLQLH